MSKQCLGRSLWSLFLGLFLAVSSTGCLMPAANPVTMSVDVQFSQAERECLQDSAKQWKAQTNGLADVRFEYDYNSRDIQSVLTHKLAHKVVRWTTLTPRVQDMTNEGFIVLGMVSKVDSILTGGPVRPAELRLVADRLEDPNVCRLTAIHELGHLFGINHIKWNEHAIMYPSVRGDRKACLKTDDLIGFCSENDCGNVQMFPCQDSEDSFAVSSPAPFDLETHEGGRLFSWLTLKN